MRTVITGLRHGHVQIVRVRLLLEPVGIPVGGHGLCTLARLDLLRQVLNSRLQGLVALGQPVDGFLDLFGIA